MYRHRIHFTVPDIDGWNTVVDVVAKVNELAARLGQPTGTLWTETVGVFNQLVIELDYESLAQFEASQKAMQADPEWGKQLKRMVGATVEGKGYSELMERAESV